MKFFEALSGFKEHPDFKHVLYRVIPRREVYDLDFKCSNCGDTLHWVCMNPDRAQWRINTWAGMHRLCKKQ